MREIVRPLASAWSSSGPEGRPRPILGNTRAEWTYSTSRRSRSGPPWSRSTRPTRLRVPLRPRELRREGRRRRGRRTDGEDPRRREKLPQLQHVVRIRQQHDALSAEQLAARQPATTRAGRSSTRGNPRGLCTFIYTSAPPARRRAADQPRQLPGDARLVNTTSVIEEEDSATLLPLAHSFALLIQLGASTSAPRSPTGSGTL